MKSTNNIKVLFIVVNAGHADSVMDTVREAGAGGATIINARGGGAHHEMFMGITIDAEKEIIFTVVDQPTAQKISETLKAKEGWKTDAQGICFVMPVDKTVGISLPDQKKED